jgi:hypothetical protein
MGQPIQNFENKMFSKKNLSKFGDLTVIVKGILSLYVYPFFMGMVFLGFKGVEKPLHTATFQKC